MTKDFLYFQFTRILKNYFYIFINPKHPLPDILAEAGLSMANVVKTVIFLADINDFAAVNAVYAKAFAEPFPARSCVQVAAIPKGAKLEIECIAVRE